MSKISDQKIIELALNSSDPTIRKTVEKLIFAIKLKYDEEEFIHIYDNYEMHHGINIIMPCPSKRGKQHDFTIAWKKENFRIISMEHQIVTGKTGDFVCGEDPATIQLQYDRY